MERQQEKQGAAGREVAAGGAQPRGTAGGQWRQAHKGYAQEAEAAGGDEVEGGDGVELDAAALQGEGGGQERWCEPVEHACEAGEQLFRLFSRRSGLAACRPLPRPTLQCGVLPAQRVLPVLLAVLPCSMPHLQQDLHQGEACGLCGNAGHLQDHSNQHEVDLCSRQAGRQAGGTRQEG